MAKINYNKNIQIVPHKFIYSLWIIYKLFSKNILVYNYSSYS